MSTNTRISSLRYKNNPIFSQKCLSYVEVVSVRLLLNKGNKLEHRETTEKDFTDSTEKEVNFFLV